MQVQIYYATLLLLLVMTPTYVLITYLSTYGRCTIPQTPGEGIMKSPRALKANEYAGESHRNDW